MTPLIRTTLSSRLVGSLLTAGMGGVGAAGLAGAAICAEPQPSPTPAVGVTAQLLEGYRDPDALLAAAKALAGPSVRVERIGVSREGRELLALRVGPPDARTAILVTAGLDGQHLVGSEVALRVASELLGNDLREKHAAALGRVAFWIVPLANPDAVALTMKGPIAQRGTLRPVDDDRDGTLDEDGPSDIDGDGVIAEMRVKDPPPPFVATLVADPSDARLLKVPETGVATKAFEAPQFAVFTEGLDRDGDGRFAEDGLGEVDLNRNFPHRYPEFAKDAGPHQISEPESQALVDFVLAHPEIVAAITYGRHDSLVKVPEGRDNDATGRTPLVHGAADSDLYTALGKLYRDTTGQARSMNADMEGSYWLWLANHRGLLSLASTVWGRPDVPKPEGGAAASPAEPAPKPAEPTAPLPPSAPPGDRPSDAEDAEYASDGDDHDHSHAAGFQTVPAAGAAQSGQAIPAQGAQQGAPSGAQPGAQQGPPGGGGRQGGFPGGGGGRGRRGGGGGNFQARGVPQANQSSGTSDAESGEWLAYSDKLRGGLGFIPWHEVVHPFFGKVDVGGFHPLFRLNPPASDLDALAAKQAGFLVELAERLPVLEVPKPSVTTLAPGMYRIELAVVNAGRLPTMPATGVTTRARPPVIARISTDVERIVGGERVRKFDSIAAGARIGVEWIVFAKADETVRCSVGSAEYGVTEFSIRDGSLVEEAR